MTKPKLDSIVLAAVLKSQEIEARAKACVAAVKGAYEQTLVNFNTASRSQDYLKVTRQETDCEAKDTTEVWINAVKDIEKSFVDISSYDTSMIRGSNYKRELNKPLAELEALRKEKVEKGQTITPEEMNAIFKEALLRLNATTRAHFLKQTGLCLFNLKLSYSKLSMNTPNFFHLPNSHVTCSVT